MLVRNIENEETIKFQASKIIDDNLMREAQENGNISAEGLNTILTTRITTLEESLLSAEITKGNFTRQLQYLEKLRDNLKE